MVSPGEGELCASVARKPAAQRCEAYDLIASDGRVACRQSGGVAGLGPRPESAAFLRASGRSGFLRRSCPGAPSLIGRKGQRMYLQVAVFLDRGELQGPR